MITREDANDALQRVGMVAMMYYPEVQVDDPEYRLSDDVTWCMEPLGAVSDTAQASLTELVGLAVVDPTAHRSALFAAVMDLAPDAE
ncbi:hypothetical protein DEA06_14815 [Microbacterium sp. Gd 4-13]|uniref:hypothetical protein n=1 Tax=Microbacterium sp. Gd 4-13 TaxID=2173179 RepID=UPI000D582DF7|nr:hypothetical protein [Microbacterium sp. Gd 4-13]PVW03026.1 hypothetical protein DEA06_14815 [Microbacterium sp. Gd 4-13]